MMIKRATQTVFNPDEWRRRRADVAACGALVAFFIAFFPQGIFGGKYLLVNDAFYYSYPLRTIAWQMIRRGQLPLWTPHVLSGYPLLSMAQLGLAYPFTWGYLFLPGYVAEQLYVLAPFLLAPVFTYAYLRGLRRSSLAALLGALTFGYGGLMSSLLANNGLLPNACMWLPLMLIALERARHRPFVPCLLGATGAYAMSVLTGVAQGFLYVGVLACAYALFLVLLPARRGSIRVAGAPPQEGQLRRFLPARWHPPLVAAGAILLAAGLAAFQILETARAARRSVRRELSYELFTQGSFLPKSLWRSVVLPLFYVIDVHAYVPPLALGLALAAVGAYVIRRQGRDPRVLFWLAVAALSYALMLGAYTPLYRLVYHLPLVNRFRVPSRHTFEWTFAAGVLAAYGWDALAPVLRYGRWRARAPVGTPCAALALLAAGAAVGFLWWHKIQTLPSGADGAARPFMTVYLLWKAGFVALTSLALCCGTLIPQRRWRTPVLGVTVLVLCYVEPSALVAHWWGGSGLEARRFTTPALATRYLQQFPPEQNRVYTRVELFGEQFAAQPRVDCANVTAVYGLHNIAGYEPLILERYSRALGNVTLDSVLTTTDRLPDSTLLSEQSYVLDILNDAFLVSYSDLAVAPDPNVEQSTIFGSHSGLLANLPPQTRTVLSAQATAATALLLVTSLANSVAVPQGELVAKARIYTTDGRVFEREVRAGVDTADWAHERSDVRDAIKHELGPVYDNNQAGGARKFTAYRYRTLLPLDAQSLVNKVELSNVSRQASFAVYSASLLRGDHQAAVPLGGSPAAAWQPVIDQDNTLVLRNARALPRAWLVAEAEAVDGEEALRRIRGESLAPFDPRRTALLEVRMDEMPALPGGPPAPGSAAQVVSYQPNQIVIETTAPTATVLVLSEIFYPGWVATVDGRAVPVRAADYLLRAVALPAGQHLVEWRYTAPGARNGGIISALTLALASALALYARRTRASETAL